MQALTHFIDDIRPHKTFDTVTAANQRIKLAGYRGGVSWGRGGGAIVLADPTKGMCGVKLWFANK